MEKEVKEKWIKALRSRKFKKGTGMLHNEEYNSFCCLGVLAKIYGFEPAYHTRNGKEYLDEELTEKFGLSYGAQHQLAKLNDGYFGIQEPLSFLKIADWIEENL